MFMGMAKNLQIEIDEQGWAPTDLSICVECVEDRTLKNAVSGSASAQDECSFCGRQNAVAFDLVVGMFVDGIKNEFNNIDDESVAYDSREGGYQISDNQRWDTWDLVEDFSDSFARKDIVESLRKSMQDRIWVKRDVFSLGPDIAMADAWENLCEQVKYKTRYVFWLADSRKTNSYPSAGEITPAEVLDHIGEVIDSQLGLISTLKRGTTFWRARTHPEGELDADIPAGELGTSPRQYAKAPNRMSPAGIPMFYGAEDQITAITEVSAHTPLESDHVTFGRFRLEKDIAVLDLTKLPAEPSIFCPQLGHLRREIRFLHKFVEQLGLKIDDEDQPIDYIPTQLVTEFFMQAHKRANNEPVIGLLYNSTANPGGLACVLDIPNDCCLEENAANTRDDDAPTLVLERRTVETRPLQN